MEKYSLLILIMIAVTLWAISDKEHSAMERLVGVWIAAIFTGCMALGFWIG